MNQTLIDKFCKIFIFVGFIVSIIYSSIIVSKYDKNYQTFDKRKIEHRFIKADTEFYFLSADNFLKKIRENDTFYNASGEYTSSYLYPKLLALFFSTLNEDIRIKSDEALIDNNEYIFKLNNGKILFLFLQSFFFYLSLFYFFCKIKKKIHKDIYIFLILFLSIEPTIIQWHSSFLTESIFLSMLMILLSLLINDNNTNSRNFFIGLFIGLMYLQKTVVIFITVPIAIYYFFSYENIKLALKSISLILLGKFIILVFLGYQNYLRSDTFYIFPWQAKFAGYYYAVDNIQSKATKIDVNILRSEKIKKTENWIKKNNINLDLEKDRRKLVEYQNKYFTEIVKKYPLDTFRYVIYKNFQSMILNPYEIYNFIHLDYTVDEYWKEKDFHINLIFNMFFSLIIYVISLFGLIYSFKNFDKSILILFLCLTVYFCLMLGWMGVSRYFLPSLVCLSPFFANGVLYLKKILKKNEN